MHRKVVIPAIALFLVMSFAGQALAAISCSRPSGHHMYFAEHVCPLGGEKFQALRLGTHSTMGQHFDLEPVSYMHVLAPIAICPTNGFPLYKTNFSEDEIAAVEQIITTAEYKDALANDTSYYVYSLVADQLKLNVAMWYIYAQASWQANLCAPHLYEKYATLTRGAAIAAQATEEPGSVSWLNLQLVIANMERRLGNFDAASIRLQSMTTHAIALEDDKKRNTWTDLAAQLIALTDAKDTSQQRIGL